MNRISHLLVVIVLLSICSAAYAQNLSRRATPLHLATSDNGIMIRGATALFTHPTTLQLQDSSSHSVHLSGSNRYNTDIRNVNLSYAYSGDTYGMGVSLSSYGIDGLSQNMVAGHFMRSLSRELHLGVSGHLYQQTSAIATTTYDGEISIHLASQLGKGWMASGLIKQPMSTTSSSIGGVGKLDVSVAHIISSELTLYSGGAITRKGDVSVRPGIRYQPHEILQLYLSTSTSPSAIAMGLSTRIGRQVHVDLGYNSHPILGQTLALGGTIKW